MDTQIKTDDLRHRTCTCNAWEMHARTRALARTWTRGVQQDILSTDSMLSDSTNLNHARTSKKIMRLCSPLDIFMLFPFERLEHDGPRPFVGAVRIKISPAQPHPIGGHQRFVCLHTSPAQPHCRVQDTHFWSCDHPKSWPWPWGERV